MLNQTLLRLMGHRNLVELQEEFTRGTLMLDLHDCDEDIKAEDDEELHFSYGRAKFSLKDLLNPFVKTLKLRSDVFPVKRTLANTENNLDLNTTAKKAE